MILERVDNYTPQPVEPTYEGDFDYDSCMMVNRATSDHGNGDVAEQDI